jgi:hypothetical protein
MSSASPQKAPVEKTRIAKLFVPSGFKSSTLLPGDRWLLRNTAEIFKTNKELRQSLGRLGIFSALTVLTPAIGIAGLFMAAPLLAAGIGVAALAGTLFSVTKLSACWKNFKAVMVPKLRTEMTVRYINMKGSRLVDKLKKQAANDQQKKPAAEKPVAPEKKTDKKASLRSFFSKRSAATSKDQPKAAPTVIQPPKP